MIRSYSDPIKANQVQSAVAHGHDDNDTASSELPHDRHVSESTDSGDWIRFDKPILYA